MAVSPLERLEDERGGAAIGGLSGHLDAFGKHETGQIDIQVHARYSPLVI